MKRILLSATVLAILAALVTLVPGEASAEPAAALETASMTAMFGCGECNSEEVEICNPTNPNECHVVGYVHGVTCDFNGFGWECDGDEFLEEGSCASHHGQCSPEQEPEALAAIFQEVLRGRDSASARKLLAETASISVNLDRGVLQLLDCSGLVAQQATLSQDVIAFFND
ncbi:MAG: hypothetical protein PVI01_04360 [Gemmatimonadales bacterium]|jgi:hypothetical protein